MSLSEDKAIIKAIRKGDQQVLSQVYQTYRQEFFFWLSKYFSCDADEAKDVYQSVILVFYENIVSGRLNELTSSVKTYLFAIGKYKMMEQMKQSHKFSGDEQIPRLSTEESNLEELTQREEDLQLIEQCLQLLGDPCKTLLELYYYQRLSMADITQYMNYKNPDTTKNLKYKCIKRLKKLFESEMSKQ